MIINFGFFLLLELLVLFTGTDFLASSLSKLSLAFFIIGPILIFCSSSRLEVGDELGASNWLEVGDELGASSRLEVGDELGASNRLEVGDELGASSRLETPVVVGTVDVSADGTPSYS